MSTEIRYATEKQVNFINKLATEELTGYESGRYSRSRFRYSCGIMLEKLKGLPVEKLTTAAASDLISECLNFRDYLPTYDRMSCDRIDRKVEIYANELLNGKYSFVPKVWLIQGEVRDGETYKMPDGSIHQMEPTCDWSGKFDYGDADPIVEDNLDENEFNKYDNLPEFEEREEDWYREGTGQYYEDRAEAMCGYEN